MVRKIMGVLLVSITLTSCSFEDSVGADNEEEEKYSDIQRYGDILYDEITGCEYVYMYDGYGTTLTPRVEMEDGETTVRGCE